MFDKFKKAKKLKDLQSSLSKEKEKCEKGGVEVTVNGQMKIENVDIDEDVSIKKAEKLIRNCTNKALKSMQKKAAKKMQDMDMGGL